MPAPRGAGSVMSVFSILVVEFMYYEYTPHPGGKSLTAQGRAQLRATQQAYPFARRSEPWGLVGV